MHTPAARFWAVLTAMATMGCSAGDVTTVTVPAPADEFATFGGDGPARFDLLPVDANSIAAILPLGTFQSTDALPSTDARLVLRDGGSVAVRAMSAGLVTVIDRPQGVITMRVRNQVSVRLAGVLVRPSLQVGVVVQAGDTLGSMTSSTSRRELSVRVLDEQYVRTRWIRPERYGARKHVAFFAAYLADSVRSIAYGLVRRAAPDLDGRIDYDRDGQLVGTWFDASASSLVAAPAALTFAYDAEQPGQVRIAAGGAVARTLRLDGVRSVAWEDPDPARITASDGMVRYHLHAVENTDRIDGLAQLLVQVLPGDRLRVELLTSEDGERSTFSARAVDLVR